jgi:thiamine biosynthesis protein ThiS
MDVIVVNGVDYILEKPTQLVDLVSQLSLQGKKLAVERNREIVPRSQFAVTELKNYRSRRRRVN